MRAYRPERKTADLSTTGRDDRALGAAFYARFWRRVGYHASRPPLSSGPERTRISCHAAQDATTCAAFIKEGRVKFASATNLYNPSRTDPARQSDFLQNFPRHTPNQLGGHAINGMRNQFTGMLARRLVFRALG